MCLKSSAFRKLIVSRNLIGRSRKIDRRGDRRTYSRTACTRSCGGDNQIQVVRHVSVIGPVGLNGLRRSAQGYGVHLVSKSCGRNSGQVGGQRVIGAGQAALNYLHVKNGAHGETCCRDSGAGNAPGKRTEGRNHSKIRTGGRGAGRPSVTPDASVSNCKEIPFLLNSVALITPEPVVCARAAAPVSSRAARVRFRIDLRLFN